MMRNMLLFVLIIMLCTTTAFAADFVPTLLKLSADPIIQYDFDGSELSIPVQVTGITAGCIFCVFTRGEASNIPNIQNGYLGWHQVNKIDTCIYYSTLKSMSAGANTIKWDGKDQDGGKVPTGEYTYYIWSFDNHGSKLMMYNKFISNDFQEYDENGLPLAHPIYHSRNNRWLVGNDPLDDTLLEMTSFTFAEGWKPTSACGTKGGATCIDPYDFKYVYIHAMNEESQIEAVTKWKWVPDGEGEFQSDFGEDGYGAIYYAPTGQEPGVITDGSFLYTGDQNHVKSSEPDADFYIIDFDGEMVTEIDLSSWWCSAENLAAGAQMNGGPSVFEEKKGRVFLNAHCSCWMQRVDPLRYLDSEELEDFFVWTNGNGDYFLDRNFEETAKLPWVCNDYQVGPYKYTIDADDNLFCVVNAYDMGAVSFGLLAPDGTGIGHFPFSGETAGWKKCSVYIDAGTPYDGMYCDNEQTGGPHYEWDEEKKTDGMYFIGHDSITGLITSGVGVEEAAPAAFSVAQNAPNPFNPTTTISFSLPEAGNVAIEVYNVAGQKVDTIADGFMNAGSHSVVWDASDFSAGVYFYTVKSGGFSKTMKMTLLK